MVQLQKDAQQWKSAGIQVVGVSYDPVKVLADFGSSAKIDFPLLSDRDSTVIKAYGVLNEKAKGFQKGIPHPQTIVVSREGKILAKLPGTVRKRHSTADLLNAVK